MKRAVPRGLPFSFMVELIAHFLRLTACFARFAVNRSRQKAFGKILCRTGRVDAGISSICLLGRCLRAPARSCAAAVPASAQGSYSPYNETPAAALARYVRALAADPKDFDSLIGAGRAALELGDTQAAAGFFARADEVDPRSPLPQAGMGAVQVANGEPQAAMPYFTRAQQLGATQAMLGCDRGLAYDLLGQQANAQADYRAALSGADAEEARRRLALSLAISGNKAGAIAALAPLLGEGRCRRRAGSRLRSRADRRSRRAR